MGTCPRCGKEGYRSVEKRSGRYYVYYIHRNPLNGKIRKCYVGPADLYEHVEILHSLGLKNIESIDYLEVAKRAVELYIERSLNGKNGGGKSRALGGLRSLLYFIKREIERLEKES
ncbi:MAG: putative integrase [Nitrososphaerota archaeon]